MISGYYWVISYFDSNKINEVYLWENEVFRIIVFEKFVGQNIDFRCNNINIELCFLYLYKGNIKTKDYEYLCVLNVNILAINTVIFT